MQLYTYSNKELELYVDESFISEYNVSTVDFLVFIVQTFKKYRQTDRPTKKVAGFLVF